MFTHFKVKKLKVKIIQYSIKCNYVSMLIIFMFCVHGTFELRQFL